MIRSEFQQSWDSACIGWQVMLQLWVSQSPIKLMPVFRYIMSLQDRISSMEARLRPGGQTESQRSSHSEQGASQPQSSSHQPDEQQPSITPIHPNTESATTPTSTQIQPDPEERRDREHRPAPLHPSLSEISPTSAPFGSQIMPTPLPASMDLYNFDTFMFESDVQANDGEESVQSLTDARSFPDEPRALLIDHFFRTIYPIFPIIEEDDFRSQLNGAYSFSEESNHELAFVLYAILAAAASDLKSNDPIWTDPRMQPYESTNLGHLFYSYASTKLPLALSNTKPVINSVIGHGLLGLCLSESGKAYEAWVTTGHAIRLYQGLDTSTDYIKDNTAKKTPKGRDNLWWCLYILDRSLSTVLLKPLAIDDEECDVEEEGNPSTPHKHPHMDFWFSVIVDFHILIGRIYKLGRAIRKSTRSSKPDTEEKLRAYVRRLDKELEDYFTQEVVPRIQESPSSPKAATLQLVAISSYYTGIILLHRAFLETYSSAEPEMLLRCAEAASACIKFTPRLLDAVPASHFLIQQLRAHFAGSKVLLRCVRLASNPSFATKALCDVDAGMAILGDAKVVWPEAKDYEKLIREELLSTKAELERQQTINKVFETFGNGLSGNTALLAQIPTITGRHETDQTGSGPLRYIPNTAASLAHNTPFLTGNGLRDIEGAGIKRRRDTAGDETLSDDLTRQPDSLASIFNLSPSGTFSMMLGDEEYTLLTGNQS